MNRKIEAHVNALFANASNRSDILDIKEELIANLNDKYNDLIISGKSEDEAFAHVISGIGDIDRLLMDLGELPEYQPLEITKNQQKRSIFISIATALYVLSFAPLIIFNSEFGMVLMCIICAVATGFIIYGSSISRVGYTKTDNSFVEEYKERFAYSKDQIKLRNAFSLSMWSLILVFYFSISFITWDFRWTWILFLLGACLQQVILYKFSDNRVRKYLWQGILWTVTVIIYFIISYTTWAWAWSWMIFLVAAAVSQVIRLLMLYKKI